MPSKNLICLVVDRLHAGMLGAYGNRWIRTDHFDHLAGESFLFDQAFVECPRLDMLYRAYWLALHAAHRDDRAAAGQTFPRILAGAGWHTALVTDEPEITGLASAADFAEQLLLDAPDVHRAAADIAETQLAHVVTTVTQWLDAPREPFCLWVHARGMGADWDAPLALRSQYADDEDPTPPDFVAPPNRWLNEAYDPDELLGITHAYAGQMTLFDACLGALENHLQETHLATTTQLTLLGARGFPLGEHRRVGACDAPLYNETVQIPWLMRFPDGLGKMARSQALVAPSDLPGTLLDWLDLDRGLLPGGRATSLLPIIRGQQDSIRDRLVLVSDDQRAIRTPAWLLRQPTGGPGELYAKPSDRWEVNEIGKLCGDVVAGLEQALAELAEDSQTGELPPLADILVTEVD